MVEKPFSDRKDLTHMEIGLRRLVDTRYQHCITRCNYAGDNLAACKNNCFQNIQVPYKMAMHQATGSEENLYKQCLASKFPKIQPTDYAACSKNIYEHKIEILGKQFADNAESLLQTLH